MSNRSCIYLEEVYNMMIAIQTGSDYDLTNLLALKYDCSIVTCNLKYECDG